MNNFKTIFYFMNEDISVIEIQRTDLPETEAKDKIYHWLAIPTSSKKVERLLFKEMGTENVNGNEINFRKFENAELRFDNNFGKFQHESNGYLVMKEDISKVSQENLETISNYLKGI